MARRLKEEVTCDAPGLKHEGKVESCEVILGGKLYKPDWCVKHQNDAKAMMPKVKPKHRGRGKMVPVDPAEIPRIGGGV